MPDSLGMDNNTLIHALRYPGGPGRSGGARILLRVAVAALLNSADPIVDYPRTTAKVIADVNAALASGNRSLMLALATKLDADNNLGCPLNGGSGHDDSGNVAGPLTGNNMLFLPIVDSE